MATTRQADNSYRYSPATVKKAFQVLRLLLDEGKGLGTSQVARKLSLAKSSAFAILEDLTKEQWISKDQAVKKYAIGMGLVELARTLSAAEEINGQPRLTPPTAENFQEG